MLDGCLDGRQAVIDTHFVPRERAYFASAALCYGARPLLTRFRQILVDISMIIKTRKTHKIDLPVKKPI